MRNKFDEQLSLLNYELIAMGSLCAEAISTASKALIDNDMALVEKAIEGEIQIDQKERDIESLCMKLLLQQQPVARDLRTISSALKMISDMERIGDQASDIAEIVKFDVGMDIISRIHIKDMAEATIKMVRESVDSFIKKDLDLALKVIDYDDVVDELFSSVKTEIIGLIHEDGKNGENCIDLLMIAKYFERIGDHAVNIAEWVEYSITGVHRKDKEAE